MMLVLVAIPHLLPLIQVYQIVLGLSYALLLIMQLPVTIMMIGSNTIHLIRH